MHTDDDVHTDDDDDDDDDDDGDDDDDDWCEPKCIWFFYDTNQNLGNSTAQNQLHRKSIEESFWLAKVCRNTQVVFEHSKKYFMSKIPNAKPIELGHNIVGLEIQWDGSLTSQDVKVEYGAECIKKHISNLRAEKVDDKDICILTRNQAVRDEIRRVLKDMEIQSQNAEQMFQKDDNRVVVESIWRFKGLESKVVILYNPPVIPNDVWTTRKIKELLYIAFSRCFCYLIVVSTDHGCNKLKSKKRLSESPSK